MAIFADVPRGRPPVPARDLRSYCWTQFEHPSFTERPDSAFDPFSRLDNRELGIRSTNTDVAFFPKRAKQAIT
jgi:hypothetical protein